MEVEFKDKTGLSVERQSRGEWKIGDALQKGDLVRISEHEYHLVKDGVAYHVLIESLNPKEKTLDLLINGVRCGIRAKGRYENLLKSLGMNDLASSRAKDLKAPMPGLVIDVEVAPGQSVVAGDNLLILEAMKMENIIKATSDAVVKEVMVSASDSVEKNQVLITFDS